MAVPPDHIKRCTRRLFLEPLEDRAVPAPLIGLQNGNQLVYFDSTTPGTITRTVNITGLGLNQSIQAIDYRPATGQLYGLFWNSSSLSARLVLMNPFQGSFTPIGNFFGFSVGASSWGFDFNPTTDRVRIVDDVRD